MIKVLQAIGEWVLLGFRSRVSLEAEIVMLRQQLGVLRHRAPKRIRPDFWDLSLPKTLSGILNRTVTENRSMLKGDDLAAPPTGLGIL
jgi:hypothetical protein